MKSILNLVFVLAFGVFGHRIPFRPESSEIGRRFTTVRKTSYFRWET